MSRSRADRLLLARGLFPSRARAQAAIEAGLVTADGAPVRRASDMLRDDAALAAEDTHPYVSRGGVKLAAALDAFGIDPAGRTCLDVGASTGGFTDVLLRRGAARVHAVDVGRGQLHPTIAADPRVAPLEATDARGLAEVFPPASFDLVTVDVSFISLRLVVGSLVSLLKTRGQLVALIKPQFEVGRGGLARGGVVKDEALREGAIAAVLDHLAGLGLAILATLPSPIAGGDGNREVLVGATRL